MKSTAKLIEILMRKIMSKDFLFQNTPQTTKFSVFFLYNKVAVMIFVDGWPLPKEMIHFYKVFKKIAKLITKFYLGSREKQTTTVPCQLEYQSTSIIKLLQKPMLSNSNILYGAFHCTLETLAIQCS